MIRLTAAAMLAAHIATAHRVAAQAGVRPSRVSAPVERLPVLAFPDPGLDDSAAYEGYQTRLFRDAAGNTVQVYLDGRVGRVVDVLADAENESVAFTARNAAGRPAILRWDAPGATVSRNGSRGAREIRYRLAADGSAVRVGLPLLGSMRVEREFQDRKQQLVPLGGAPYRGAEFDSLITALAQLPPAVQRQHLALLGAPDLATLRARVVPRLTLRAPSRSGGGNYVARVVQPSLDGRDTLTLELRADARTVAVTRAGDSFTLQAPRAVGEMQQVRFTVTVTTTGRTLTPLSRQEIFTPDFLAFVNNARSAAERAGASDSVRLRARVLERQVRGVELLASREKFMAGLPTYATYFGRDQLMTALMMRPIWRDQALEVVIGSVLRALSPEGAVSHEESIGEQATREAAIAYARLIEAETRAARAGARRT
ncbi:MAG: hypothetical protein M3154_04920, partial [Candidatus Eremiobacteraeota bacterium]|nr:hypothetical protein [Candidatus Eremiobacteraeota bacterium]